MSFTSVILGRLMEKMDKDDHSKVYLREIYGTQYDLSTFLFSAGKTLQQKSNGWIKLKHDPQIRLNYVEVS